MGVLNDFERRLEGAVEGFFARAFRSGVQPVELAKALQHYAEDTQHVTEDGVVVPNVYRFRLNSRDIDRLESFGDRLHRELAEVVVRTAKDRGWRLRGPALVHIESAEDVDFGRYEVAGRVDAVDDDATGAVSDVTARDKREASLELRVRNGDSTARLALTGSRLVVGRKPACDLSLHDPTVSREHAAFVRRGDDWWVVDLDSTNGTRVNGASTAEHGLEAGDRIELGEAVLELVRR